MDSDGEVGKEDEPDVEDESELSYAPPNHNESKASRNRQMDANKENQRETRRTPRKKRTISETLKPKNPSRAQRRIPDDDADDELILI